MKAFRKMTALFIIALVVVALPMMTLTGCKKSVTTSKVIKIAMMPKFKGENYFDAAKTGAQAAVADLNKSGTAVQFLYDGPPQDQATNQEQVNILQGWIAQKVNVIILSADDPTAIAPTLKNAQSQGIKVITFDADAETDARSLFVNQVTSDGVAGGLVKSAADQLKSKGYGPSNPANIALVSSATTDANQQSWVKGINTLLATSDYSWMKIKNPSTDIYYPGPDETTNETQCGTLIGRMGVGADKIQCAIGLTSMATPALGAQYASASAKPDVTKVVITGLATPNALKEYIKDDSNPLKTGVLWNVQSLGYLALQTGYQMAKGTITASSTSITAGKLGPFTISNQMIVLGPAMIFDKSNIDTFNY
jgi:ABC-type sugar transport system substrate-binding protein